jgi:tRNA A58 N-methylase Trm61
MFSKCAIFRHFVLGDCVLLQDAQHRRRLIGPLVETAVYSTQYGVIRHADIVGKQSTNVVLSHTGKAFTVHEPTLAEYVHVL